MFSDFSWLYISVSSNFVSAKIFLSSNIKSSFSQLTILSWINDFISLNVRVFGWNKINELPFTAWYPFAFNFILVVIFVCLFFLFLINSIIGLYYLYFALLFDLRILIYLFSNLFSFVFFFSCSEASFGASAGII